MNIKYAVEHVKINISVFIFSNLFCGGVIVACQKLPDAFRAASRVMHASLLLLLFSLSLS